MFLILKLQTWVHPESTFKGLCEGEEEGGEEGGGEEGKVR